MGLLCRLVRARRGRCRDVYLVARCEDGSRRVFRVEGFEPYFYVPSSLGEYVGIDGATLERVVARCPEDVPSMRSSYTRHYEADIPYARRFLIDSGIRSYFEAPDSPVVTPDQLRPVDDPGRVIPLRVWYLDIEVHAPRLPSPSDPEYPVIIVTYYDSIESRYVTHAWHSRVEPGWRRGRRRITACGEARAVVDWEVHFHRDEAGLFEALASDMDLYQPDIITGWNVSFDMGYLHARAERLGVKLDRTPAVMDLMEAFKRVGPRTRSNALKSVTVEVGIECREDAVGAPEALRGWEEDPANGVLYNLRDVWRIVEIDSRYRLVDFFVGIKELAGVEDLSRVDRDWRVRLYTSLPIVDTLVLRVARSRGLVLPSSPEEASREEYRGGIVLDPVPGVHEGVAVLDMSRYYPSIIISFNVSPELKDSKVDPVNGIWSFRRDREGILPEAVRSLLELRERLEERLSKLKPGTPEYEDVENKIMAVKGLTNSFYGVTANAYFRLFDVDVASTITGLAREGILYVVSQARELGYEPLYGDTDSVFVRVPFEEAQGLAEELTRRLRRYFMEKYGLEREPVLKLKFEKYYQRIFFKPRTKKRYAGLLVWKKGQKVDPPKLDIVGFEAVRTDSAPFTARVQEELFRAILSGAGRGEVYSILSRLASEMRRAPLDEIALGARLSRDLHEYKARAPQVRAALYSNLYLGTSFGAGDRVMYVFVRAVRCRELPPTDVVAFDESTMSRVEECFEIDWPRMAERILYSPASEILSAVGIRVQLNGMRRTLL